MKIILYLFAIFIVFSNINTYAQDDNAKVDGRYGSCFQKKGFDSYSENQPPDTWGFKNVEVYSEYIYFYDAAFPGQSNNFLLLSKASITRISTNNIGNETTIYTNIRSGSSGVYEIRLRSTGTHDKFIAILMN